MSSAFGDSGAGASKMHSYMSVEDLYTNALMRRDGFVLIRNSGGEFVYYIPDGPGGSVPKHLINVETGQVLPINNFINSPISIGKVPDGRALSSYGVWARTSQYAKEAISKGVNFYAVNVKSQDYARAMNILQANEHKVSKSVRQALMEASEMTAKKVMSVDFETGVPLAMESSGNNLQNKMVLTGALAETTDYMVHLKGSPDGLSELRLRESRAVEYFDLNTVRSWAKEKSFSSEAFFRDRENGMEFKFGKKNFALLMDALRERRMRQLSRRMQWSDRAKEQYRRLDDMGSLLEREMSGEFTAGQSMTEFGKRFRMFRRDLRSVTALALRNERASRTRGVDPNASTAHGRFVTWQSVGEVSQTSMLGTGESQITTVDLRLTSDPTSAVAEDISEYVTKSGKRVNAFGSLEQDILREKMKQLELVMTGNDPSNEKKALATGLHEKLSKALVNMNDMKSLSQLFLHDYLPSVQKMAEDSRTIFDRVAERMGITGEEKADILSAMEINPKNPFTRGFSLEQLIRTMHSADKYKEYHVASMDAADLNAYVEALDRIKSGSDTVKKAKAISGSSSKYFQYGIEAVRENLWETSARFASEVNSKTMASVIAERMNSKGVAKLFKKAGFDLNKKEFTVQGQALERLISRNINEVGSTTFEVTEGLNKIIRSHAGDVVNDLVSESFRDSQKRISLNAEPGFLSRILSRQHVPRIFAFYALSQLTRTPGGLPQTGNESIERGEHASIATIARRISTTDFGSPVAFGSPAARKLIGAVLNKTMSVIRKMTPKEGVIQKGVVAGRNGAVQMESAVRPENLKWASITAEQKGVMLAADPTSQMVVDSAEARIRKEIAPHPGGYLVSAMRDKGEKQIAYEYSKRLNEALAATKPRAWEIDTNKFALLETTQKVDKHMLSLKSTKHSYVTSPYGDTNVPEHSRIAVEKWFDMQQKSPGHTWVSRGRTSYPSSLEMAIREDAFVDRGRSLRSFEKRIHTGLETAAYKSISERKQLAAEVLRTDYSDGIYIKTPKMNANLIEEIDVISTARPIQGMDVKNAYAPKRSQWIAGEVSDNRTPVVKNIPLYTPEGTTTSLNMSPAQVPLKKPAHTIASARFTNRKEKVPVAPILRSTKPELEMPVIMPTNVGPAGIAPLRVPRNQPALAPYHELFTMNMKTRQSNGWEESGKRVVEMAMVGLRANA